MTHPNPAKCRRVLAFLVFVVAGFTTIAHPQSETGSISGAVTDPSGFVVVGAKVSLIDLDRGSEVEVATGNRGFYSFSDVRPGRYGMQVEKNGFKLVRLSGVTLNVQGMLEQKFRLEVGDVHETITVEANKLEINTTDGTVSTVIDRHFAENIPLNGRSFQTLIMLAPGVVVTQTAFDDQGQFSINGQRANANYFTVDGVSANFGMTAYGPLVQTAGGSLPALSAQGGTNSLVSVDAMQEFRIQTSSFAPEFGRTPGGQISIATRSGTNAFHGTLFEYFRNSVLDAKDWFNGYTNNPPLPKAEERQNDFGGVLGGPIVKDRTFFFFSYEGLRLRQPLTELTVVPDKTSRQQAPAGMRPYLTAYPIPNGPEVSAGSAQFSAGFSDPSTLDATSFRLDQTLNAKWNLFGRYNYSPSSLTQRAPNQGYEPNLSTTGTISSTIHTFTLGLTGAINARITNEARANYSNDKVGTQFAMDNFGGAMPLPDSALFPPGFSSKNGVFGMEILGVGELLQGKFAIDEQRQVNLIDSFSVTHGPHAMKFGVDYRWLSPFTSIFTYRLFAQFTGMGAATGGALSGIAAVAAPFAYQPCALLAENYSFYGLDTWKASPRLTMTYGLRWDINPALKGKNLANQPFTVNGLDNPATMTLATRGTSLYETTYGNVAPRVGVAYQFGGPPNWETVLRGGFGIFYDLGYGSLGGASSYFPFFAVKTIARAPFPLSAADAAPPPITTSPPVSTILVADRNLSLPRTYEWNVALEQAAGANQSFSLTYVGAIGRDLLRSTFLYNPNPSFQTVDVTSNTATSDYNALQVKFERRLSQGLQALVSYTWSHSIDIASTDAFADYLNTPGFLGNPNIDRADSDFDIRNSFTAGVTYSLPSPQNGGFAQAVLGGWSVDAFLLARSAPPVNVIGAIQFAGGTAIYPRPNVVPGVPLELYGSQYPGGKIFNKAAFTAPPPGKQGNFGRNILRGFGASQADLAFQRQFHLVENLQLRFRGEFFNLFNHPNFGPPTNSLTSSFFGYATETLASSLSGADNAGFNPLYQIGGPRSVQLALKLQF
jgi:hypothetical protein